ncbi:MAG: DUF4239 domain-containing protein [Anaerolineae bacterium]|nr:DUF4239 domain-containing protein [Anaerolineae bacterium]
MQYLNNLPLAISLIIVVLLTVTLAVGFLVFTRVYIRRHFNISDETDDTVQFYAGAIAAFYGIALAFITVANWENYTRAVSIVSAEAASVGALYRDVTGYPEPLRTELKADLKEYLEFVVNQAWPAQQQGVVIQGSVEILNKFQDALLQFEPATEGQKVIHGEAFSQYNEFISNRRQRIDFVDAALPTILWVIILGGAVITIFVTYFFYVPNVRLHILLIVCYSMLIAVVIYFTALMENPLKGPVGITPSSYQTILDTLVNVPSAK